MTSVVRVLDRGAFSVDIKEHIQARSLSLATSAERVLVGQSVSGYMKGHNIQEKNLSLATSVARVLVGKELSVFIKEHIQARSLSLATSAERCLVGESV